MSEPTPIPGQLYRLDPDYYNLAYTHGGGKQCRLEADELLVFMGQRVVEEGYGLYDEYTFLSPKHGQVILFQPHKEPLSLILVVVDEEKNP